MSDYCDFPVASGFELHHSFGLQEIASGWRLLLEGTWVFCFVIVFLLKLGSCEFSVASEFQLHQDCSELHLVGGYCWKALGCGSKTAGLPGGRCRVALEQVFQKSKQSCCWTRILKMGNQFFIKWGIAREWGVGLYFLVVTSLVLFSYSLPLKYGCVRVASPDCSEIKVKTEIRVKTVQGWSGNTRPYHTILYNVALYHTIPCPWLIETTGMFMRQNFEPSPQKQQLTRDIMKPNLKIQANFENSKFMQQ